MYEDLGYYLLSTIIQSLAALMAISFIVNDYMNRRIEQIYFELFQLADIWWQRDNSVVGQTSIPDVKRHTTIEDAPNFLRRNINSIRRHKDIHDAVIKKLYRLNMLNKWNPQLFKYSLAISFFVILFASVALIFTAHWSKFDWFLWILIPITLFFLCSIFLFVFMIYQAFKNKKKNSTSTAIKD